MALELSEMWKKKPNSVKDEYCSRDVMKMGCWIEKSKFKMEMANKAALWANVLQYLEAFN